MSGLSAAEKGESGASSRNVITQEGVNDGRAKGAKLLVGGMTYLAAV